MRLFKRDNGFYYVEISHGVVKTLRTKNKQLANELFREIQSQQILGNFINIKKTKSITIAEFQTEHFAIVSGVLATGTMDLFMSAFTSLTALIPANTPIKNVTTKNAEQFIAHLISGKKLKPATVNICLRTIRSAFNKAVEWGYLDVSPFAKIKQLPIKNPPMRSLSMDEIKKILSLTNDIEFKEFLLTALYTGARRQSIANLCWEDFIAEDITKNGTNQKIYFVKFKHIKTSELTIPASDRLQENLFYRRASSGAVFPKFYNNEKLATAKFIKLAKKANIKARLHDLRHTFCTHLVLHGVPLRTVQSLAGHSDIHMTEKYTKLAAEHLRGTTDLLDYSQL